MYKLIKKNLVVMICGLVCTIAYSQDQTTTAAQQNSLKPNTKVITCPTTKELVKNQDTNKWAAENNKWQSNYTSLATKIDRLLGAQWQGINLGQPFCIYKGIPATTFPIILAYHTLALRPANGLWKKDAKHKSIFKCMTANTKYCPFIVRLKAKAPSIDSQIDSIIPGKSARANSNQGF